MTLSPPIKLEPGTCGCSVDGLACACMPANAAELLTRLSEARYRGDEAERTRLAKQLNDSMTYRADGARKDNVTKYYTSPEQRAEHLARACTMTAEAFGAAEARRLRERCDGASDAFVKTRLDGAIASAEDELRWRDRERIRVDVRLDSAITDRDREQARSEIEMLHGARPFASPHAKRADAADIDAAVEMRARSLARQRLAAADRDALARATPRKPEAARTDEREDRESRDAFVSQYASPHATSMELTDDPYAPALATKKRSR